MNNVKKPVFQQPKFQPNDGKQPKARSVKKRQAEKDSRNQPHFASRQESHPDRSRRQTIETAMDNADGTGKVKVLVKRVLTADKPKQKKTGPLSPRAPEKIKKNRAEEMKVYGESACLALFARRPESIIRLWATVETAHKTGDIFSYLAANKKAYHVVNNRELELVSGTEHHGGICMLVKKSRPFTLTGYLDIPRQKDCLVLLEDVRNAYNIGGIIRTCAFYGITGVITEAPELLNSAAMRVAEGGAEYVRILQTDYTDGALSQLRRAGYQIIRTTTDKRAKGFDKVRLENKVVFVLSESGSEGSTETGDEVINLSFANPLLKNGLNVAVQAGILLAKRAEKTE